MDFHILTSVWGAQHCEIFLAGTFPNVLSPNNLPALAQNHNVIYRFFTTEEDKQILSSNPLMRIAEKFLKVEYVTPLGKESPRPDHHVHWIHKAAAEARLAGAGFFIVPPDTLWNDGVFEFAGNQLADGKKAVITSLTQVVLETLLPEAKQRFQKDNNSIMSISGQDLVELSLRHLHPVTCLSLDESPHARPAIDKYWSVAKSGLAERHSRREMFAFNPSLIEMTFLWYPGALDDEGIVFPEDSDIASMLSLDPLHKSFPTYIFDHTVEALDIARMSTHPLNDTHLNEFYTSLSVNWHQGNYESGHWDRANEKANNCMMAVQVCEMMIRIHRIAHQKGCHEFARFLAASLQILGPENLLPSINITGVRILSDIQFLKEVPSVEAYLEVGKEKKLNEILGSFFITTKIDKHVSCQSIICLDEKEHAASVQSSGQVEINDLIYTIDTDSIFGKQILLVN